MSVSMLRVISEMLILLLVGGFWVTSHQARVHERKRQKEAMRLHEVALVLGDLVRAEKAFMESVRVDEDGDGLGEYGFLSELCGAAAPRGQEETLEPGALERVEFDSATGFFRCGDYFLTVYLPGPGGEGAILDPSILGTYGPDLVTADEAEQRFVAYAWPQNLDWEVFIPPPAFAVTAAHEIVWCMPRRPYVRRRRPAPLAAWPEGALPGLEPGGVGRDGERWFDLERVQPWMGR